ncbi:MAG TPA: alpha/beta hydrolase [Chryseosolibacter sp.]|nr:alpha/beta hydrolase [Chryseosolibacter sp.]
MEELSVNFQFKARYFKTGILTDRTREVWFVLHGYGQLAGHFIKKFAVLEQHGICVIAPEGLSRFYLSDLSPGSRRANDRVGATWMTKENRLTDIENYISYLTEVYQAEMRGLNIPVTIVGFSQGSATVSRWAMSGKIAFDRLILWAGIFPPDMDFGNGSQILSRKKVVLVYGKRDPFLNDDRFAEMKSLTEKLGVEVIRIEFDGEHEIHAPTLLHLVTRDDSPS